MKMKIIDKQNEKHTKPENFEVWNFIYDEATGKHYWIVANDGCYFVSKLSLICLERKIVICQKDSVEGLLRSGLDDTNHLIRIYSDQVTMSFDRE